MLLHAITWPSIETVINYISINIILQIAQPQHVQCQVPGQVQIVPQALYTSNGAAQDAFSLPQDQSAAAPRYPIQRRIVGGKVTPYTWPWMVSVFVAREHLVCGGSLIRADLVVTSAHCVLADRVKRGISVLAGAHDISHPPPDSEHVTVARVIRHEKYNEVTDNNDIAILKLERPLTMGYAKVPVELPLQGEELNGGRRCVITGWGQLRETLHAPTAEKLHHATIPVIDQHDCKGEYYKNFGFNTKTMICAGHVKGGPGSCDGDSGGPLVCPKDGRWVLYGITSWTGKGCGRKDHPSVFAKVSNYVHWIHQHAASLNY